MTTGITNPYLTVLQHLSTRRSPLQANDCLWDLHGVIEYVKYIFSFGHVHDGKIRYEACAQLFKGMEKVIISEQDGVEYLIVDFTLSSKAEKNWHLRVELCPEYSSMRCFEKKNEECTLLHKEKSFFAQKDVEALKDHFYLNLCSFMGDARREMIPLEYIAQAQTDSEVVNHQPVEGKNNVQPPLVEKLKKISMQFQKFISDATFDENSLLIKRFVLNMKEVEYRPCENCLLSIVSSINNKSTVNIKLTEKPRLCLTFYYKYDETPSSPATTITTDFYCDSDFMETVRKIRSKLLVQHMIECVNNKKKVSCKDFSYIDFPVIDLKNMDLSGVRFNHSNTSSLINFHPQNVNNSLLTELLDEASVYSFGSDYDDNTDLITSRDFCEVSESNNDSTGSDYSKYSDVIEVKSFNEAIDYGRVNQAIEYSQNSNINGDDIIPVDKKFLFTFVDNFSRKFLYNKVEYKSLNHEEIFNMVLGNLYETDIIKKDEMDNIFFSFFINEKRLELTVNFDNDNRIINVNCRYYNDNKIPLEVFWFGEDCSSDMFAGAEDLRRNVVREHDQLCRSVAVPVPNTAILLPGRVPPQGTD